MLLEMGFKVTSVDISDKMLKYALKKRWTRRSEKAFDEWVIEEANWLTLPEDIQKPGEGFDALICLGNSFPQLVDTKGDKSDIKLAIRNFHRLLKPNGCLIIDHRNFDCLLKTGKWPMDNIYYTCKNIQYNTIDKSPTMILLDCSLDLSRNTKKEGCHKEAVQHMKFKNYPHQLEDFTSMLKEVFGQSSNHEVYGDYQPLDAVDNPAFFIHFIQKTINGDS